jgi:hypothetical protein
MDFRNPNIVGTFVYHCHLLEHEDGGMMGTIRVEPRKYAKRQLLLQDMRRSQGPQESPTISRLDDSFRLAGKKAVRLQK